MDALSLLGIGTRSGFPGAAQAGGDGRGGNAFQGLFRTGSAARNEAEHSNAAGPASDTLPQTPIAADRESNGRIVSASLSLLSEADPAINLEGVATDLAAGAEGADPAEALLLTGGAAAMTDAAAAAQGDDAGLMPGIGIPGQPAPDGAALAADRAGQAARPGTRTAGGPAGAAGDGTASFLDAASGAEGKEPAAQGARDTFMTEWSRVASGQKLAMDEAALRLKANNGEQAGRGVSGDNAEAPILTATGDEGADALITRTANGADFAREMARAEQAEMTRPQNPARANAPVDQVAFQIQRSVANGTNKITMQMDPAELGRVSVALEFSEDGTVRAVVAADRPETMELLQRDSKALERALNNAGLRTDSDSLSFDMRGQGRDGESGEAGGRGDDAGGTDGDTTSDDDALTDPVTVNINMDLTQNGRVDVRI